MVQLKQTSGVNEFHSPVPFLYALVSIVDQMPGVSFSRGKGRGDEADVTPALGGKQVPPAASGVTSTLATVNQVRPN